MLVPLLICKTALSAVLLLVNEAWKAVCGTGSALNHENSLNRWSEGTNGGQFIAAYWQK